MTQPTQSTPELDEILRQFENKIASDVRDALTGRKGARTFGVEDDPRAETHAQINKLITSKQLEARIEELEMAGVRAVKKLGNELGLKVLETNYDRHAKLQAQLHQGRGGE